MDGVRWGIMSTANIARASFLPALRAAGGRAYAVAGRDRERTERYAAEHGIERALVGYEALLEDRDIDAVYIALPNSLHAGWTIEALRAGKAVLCEKPLCTSVQETEGVLEAARQTGGLVWEAFVFPFQPQMRRLRQIVDGGEIGEVREVESSFHFRLRNRDNIRLSPQLGGGALNDVGCYCIHLANFVFGGAPQRAASMAVYGPEGVDDSMQGVLAWEGGRRLSFSCGMFRAYDTFSRVLGTEGEIRLTNPFHPTADDTLEVRVASGEARVEPSGQTEPSFTPAIRHIQRVLCGEEVPRHLAVEDSLPTAIGLALARASARVQGARDGP